MTDKPQFVEERGQKVKLNNLCSRGKSSLRQKDVSNDGPYAVYGASGLVGTMASFQNTVPYVAVVKDGAGVGRASACEANTSVLGTMQALIPREGIDRDYLLHLVRSLHLGDGFSGSTIPHIYFKDYGKLPVRLHSPAEQKRIVDIFASIERQIKVSKQQLDQLDSLVKSRFVDMFGDPIINSKNWQTKRLESMGELKNGVNFKSVGNGYEVKCLSVRDFKDKYSIDDMSQIGTVSLNGRPNASQMLKNGDIVFVRSNGNKALVGRCLAVFPKDEKLTFSGFCIRFRIESNDINLDYFLNCMKSDSMRKAMIGRGANIQNLSQAILSKLSIPIPPLSLQQEFVDFARQVNKSRFVAQQQIGKLQMLYDSLAQEYFGD